jgi:hypothetical protein
MHSPVEAGRQGRGFSRIYFILLLNYFPARKLIDLKTHFHDSMAQKFFGAVIFIKFFRFKRD